jgi:hypothetical protein
MLPQNALSIVPITAPYLVPDDYPITKYVDYEQGGISIQDPSQGLQVQIWKLEYTSNRVMLSAPNTPRRILFSSPNIREISLAFDQNMRPAVAYMEGDQAKLWWYDTQVAGEVFTDLPAGSTSPKACLDDKRDMETALSDIIVAYMRDKGLRFRVQRERFLIEYTLAVDLDATLIRVGMNTKNRLQFELLPNV